MLLFTYRAWCTYSTPGASPSPSEFYVYSLQSSLPPSLADSSLIIFLYLLVLLSHIKARLRLKENAPWVNRRWRKVPNSSCQKIIVFKILDHILFSFSQQKDASIDSCLCTYSVHSLVRGIFCAIMLYCTLTIFFHI